MGYSFDSSIVRKYDIRGRYGVNLGEEDAYALGRTLGSLCQEGVGRIGDEILIGRDGRVHGAALEDALCRGVMDSGMDAVRLGQISTPGVYYAEKLLRPAAAVQVTGSHNPPEDNGFKVVLGGQPFFGAALEALATRSAAGNWVQGQGAERTYTVLPAYRQRMLDEAEHLAARKIAWDAGNGVMGAILEGILPHLPGEHYGLCMEVDGTFPVHPPDPTKESNLELLRHCVLEQGCDWGFAFDGDGDRLGVVDHHGRVVPGDVYMMLMADDVLAGSPGGTVVYDVKCSDRLGAHIEALGGRAQMVATGHSVIKDAMRTHQAVFAGEMSGHLFFADQYGGFDDGLYAALRLWRWLGSRDLATEVGRLPPGYGTPELRLVLHEDSFAVIRKLAAHVSAQGVVYDDTDGVRVQESEGWWLARGSHTEQALVLRVESVVGEEALKNLCARVRGYFSAIDCELPPEVL